jgi:hypothetical protein
MIHIITDIGGFNYFEALWNKNNLYEQLPRVSLVFHDYFSICVQGIDSFLDKFSLPLSSHHSGKAGYCRLFFSKYFTELRSIVENNHKDSTLINSIIPDQIIVLETDQLVLDDVENLWIM